MKTFSSILLSILVSTLFTQMHAMEIARVIGKKDKNNPITEIIEVKKNKKEEPKICQLVSIIINNLGDNNGAMVDALRSALLSTSIIMVTPSILKKIFDIYKSEETHGTYYYRLKKSGKKTGETQWTTYPDLLISEYIFLDLEDSHFIMIFPKEYKDCLSENGYKTYTFEKWDYDEWVKSIDRKRKEELLKTGKADFECIAQICKKMHDKFFHLHIHGHGKAHGDDQECVICNLSPSAAQEMLLACNIPNITTVELNTCCLGLKNRRFISSEKYLFHLIIRGITDNSIFGFSGFPTITTDMTPQEVVLALIEYPNGSDQKRFELQIMPAGTQEFITYENKYFAILNDVSKIEKYTLENKNLLIYATKIETFIEIFKEKKFLTLEIPLVIKLDTEIPQLFFMTPHESGFYALEEIFLASKNTGIVCFIEQVFAKNEYLSKCYLIKKLHGKNDIEYALKGIKTDPESNDSMSDITLFDVQIYAGENISFYFIHQDKKYVGDYDENKKLVFKAEKFNVEQTNEKKE